MTRGSRVRSAIIAFTFALSTVALTAPAAAASTPGATGGDAALAPPTNLRVVGTAFDGWHSWPVLDWERSADDGGYYWVNFQAVDPANPFPSASDQTPGPEYNTSQAGYGHCLEGAYEVTVQYMVWVGGPTGVVRSAPSNTIRVELPFWLSG